jgi:hypothetical protein
MVPVSVVASGAFSQPWLHGCVDETLKGCAASQASQGKSLCGMATVFESPCSGSDLETNVDTLQGRSDHTANSHGSYGAQHSPSPRGEADLEGEGTARATPAATLDANDSVAKSVDHAGKHPADLQRPSWNGSGSSHVSGGAGGVPVPAIVTAHRKSGSITQVEPPPSAAGDCSDRSSGKLLADDGWNTVICGIEKSPHASCRHVLLHAAQARSILEGLHKGDHPDLESKGDRLWSQSSSGQGEVEHGRCNSRDLDVAGVDAIPGAAAPHQTVDKLHHMHAIHACHPLVSAGREDLRDSAGVGAPRVAADLVAPGRCEVGSVGGQPPGDSRHEEEQERCVVEGSFAEVVPVQEVGAGAARTAHCSRDASEGTKVRGSGC